MISIISLAPAPCLIDPAYARLLCWIGAASNGPLSLQCHRLAKWDYQNQRLDIDNIIISEYSTCTVSCHISMSDLYSYIPIYLYKYIQTFRDISMLISIIVQHITHAVISYYTKWMFGIDGPYNSAIKFCRRAAVISEYRPKIGFELV